MIKEIISYKYPPIYKYSFLLLIIFMFFKHQKILSQEKILINTILITLFVGFIDHVMIENHPNLFYIKEFHQHRSYHNNTHDTIDDIDDILDLTNDVDEDSEVSILNNIKKDNVHNINLKQKKYINRY